MKKNMGSADRIIRLTVAAIIAVLYFTNVINETLGLILLIIAGVFALTSFISFCPLYPILGLSTCAANKK
jgi:fatty acid desaturase